MKKYKCPVCGHQLRPRHPLKPVASEKDRLCTFSCPSCFTYFSIGQEFLYDELYKACCWIARLDEQGKTGGER